MADQLLDRARGEIRSTVDDARLAVWNLRQGSEAGGDLINAVSRLSERITREAGVSVHMRERVEKLGGEFKLTSAPGKGTQVRLRIPRAARAATALGTDART